jgi:hypothetical protein
VRRSNCGGINLDIFEIRDTDIDSEEILRRIRENIEKRKEGGAYLRDEIDELNKPIDRSSKSKWNQSGLLKGKIEDDIQQMELLSDLENDGYIISTHRPILGKALLKGRELVHGEVRRYIGPILSQQTEFNGLMINVLCQLARKNEELSAKIKKIENMTCATDCNTFEVPRRHEIKFINFTKAMNYADKIRGTDEIIADLFAECKNVLNIGSGYGIFLDLLEEKNIKGYGIDRDGEIVENCRSRGLSVEKDDAIGHLRMLNDKSLDGIYISNPMMQAANSDLAHLIELCSAKLQERSLLVISIRAISNAYIPECIDYKNQIEADRGHLDEIVYLLESNKFRDVHAIECKILDPERKLGKLGTNKSKNSQEQQVLFGIFDHNMDILNELLFRSSSYFVVGAK